MTSDDLVGTKRTLPPADDEPPAKRMALFALKYENGDLFTASSSLAHCVSRDLEMGKGIALEFKKRFGQVDKLKQQNGAVGDVVYLSTGMRYIFYLITKERYYQKPSYETLRASLRKLLRACKECGVKSLAMPCIGCGLDKLEWSKVASLITEIFSDSDVVITIYQLVGVR
jgi:O-acetyl-ADP-ribose deacetylase (regulator of RNase III)